MNRPRQPIRAGVAVRHREPASDLCSVSLGHRKYQADLRPEVAAELSARIEYEGQHAFFPLAQTQRAPAERQAEAIRSAVARSGWAAGARFVREFTLAVFWLPNPLTCTYATLFTALAPPAVARPVSTPRVRVALYEPDEQVRWGLMHWLNRLPDYECVAAHASPAAFFKHLAQARPGLALFNDPPCTPASAHIQEQLAVAFPTQIGFPIGIYRDSEHAWYCVTGVDGGYFYRRRRPVQMLEPISGLWQTHQPSRDAVESQIRNHVQTLFGLRAASADAFPGLTRRERDVLLGLRRGHTDKTLAALLRISSWTVHTHMKSLFEKLGVHTRAEAVAKFFEK
jgi:DNA-binding NarL/FixJ family response regulator